MAFRLINPPLGLGIVSGEPLSGPRTIGGGGSQGLGGFIQTVASPFGVWRWRWSLRPMMDDEFRRYRGWVTALHGGANATRWPFVDPDRISFRSAGMTATDEQMRAGMPWANGNSWDVPGRDPWFNTGNWQITHPIVPLAAPVERGASIVELSDTHWGHRLDIGDYLGFLPFYFGLHTITEVLAPGRYRIWPPLRKAFTLSDFATLDPVLAMRPESEDAATAGRGLSAAEGITITMIEVPDYDVRDYFEG